MGVSEFYRLVNARNLFLYLLFNDYWNRSFGVVVINTTNGAGGSGV